MRGVALPGIGGGGAGDAEISGGAVGDVGEEKSDAVGRCAMAG
jgi:hypothetical protein